MGQIEDNRLEQYNKLAQDVLAAYQSGDSGAMQRINGRSAGRASLRVS